MGEYAAVKTSVWWDIENCCVPRNCDAQLIVQNMSSALAAAGYRGPISVSAYGDTHQIPHNVQHALSSTGVSLNHVPAGIKDASDKKILVDMLFWAIDNPPPANYLLISGDRDFSNAIHKLKMRRYNVLLAQPQRVSQTLAAAAKSVWLWRSLVAGEPPLAESPYISCTSSGNKDDLDTSKNIISSSSDMTQDTNPEVPNILCGPQSGANSNADKKHEVKQPREMQTDNVSKKPNRRFKKRSNPGGSGFSKQTASKKSKGGNRSIEQSKFKQARIGQVKAVPGQRLICYRCGEGHLAAECTFNGDCHICGKPGHKDRVCKENPNSIVKWMPAHAQDLATSLPGSVQVMSSASQLHPACSSPSECSQQVIPGVPSLSPAPPMAPVPPQTGDGLPSVPAHSGVSAMPTAVEVGREDVAQPTTSVPRPSKAFPACRPSQGQGMICFKCGVVGHCAAECTYTGSCRRCGQLGHMERVCKENPDSIIKWEQVHAYVLATSSQGSVRTTAPTSQLQQTWTPPPGCFLQAAPALPTPSPTPAAPASPHTGVAAASTPAHPGVSTTPTAVSLGKQDVVPQPTSSALPHAAVLACQQVLRQYHQSGASQLLPAWTQPPGYSSTTAQPGACTTPTVSLGKPDMVPQPTSSALRPPADVLAYQPILGQYHQAGTSQMLPAWTQPPGYFWQAAPVVPSPLPPSHLTPVPPQPGAAAPPRPAHYGAYPMPFPFGRPW